MLLWVKMDKWKIITKYKTSSVSWFWFSWFASILELQSSTISVAVHDFMQCCAHIPCFLFLSVSHHAVSVDVDLHGSLMWVYEIAPLCKSVSQTHFSVVGSKTWKHNTEIFNMCTLGFWIIYLLKSALSKNNSFPLWTSSHSMTPLLGEIMLTFLFYMS